LNGGDLQFVLLTSLSFQLNPVAPNP